MPPLARHAYVTFRSCEALWQRQPAECLTSDVPDEVQTTIGVYLQGLEGDVVEVPDPRRGPDGVERRLARTVKVNDMGPASMRHIAVKWGAAPVARVAAVRRLTFENLHPAVQEAAGALYADGDYESAVSQASGPSRFACVPRPASRSQAPRSWGTRSKWTAPPVTSPVTRVAAARSSVTVLCTSSAAPCSA